MSRQRRRRIERERAKGRECKHPNATPKWETPYPGDEAICGLSADQVRENWPRRHCDLCNAIVYESFEHYLAGDY